MIKRQSANGQTTIHKLYELRRSGMVNSSSTTSDTRSINLVTTPVISHESGKNREVYPWSFVTQIFHNGQPGDGGDR